jgi:hypothetical protein
MKKKRSPEVEDDLRPEYGPDLFAAMKPNRFAGQLLQFKGKPLVALDPDVAKVFQSAEAVNDALRATMRKKERPAAARTARSASSGTRSSRSASASKNTSSRAGVPSRVQPKPAAAAQKSAKRSTKRRQS